METNGDNLKNLLHQLKHITFWQRLFGWNRIRQSLLGAMADVQNMLSGNAHLQDNNRRLEKDLSAKQEVANNCQQRNTELQSDLAALRQRLDHLDQDYKKATEQNTQLLKES